ncbi:MCE family protein [Mycolicibacterium holsaticum]|uniref:Mammalian cell entry protein n=1 Tax=Mycolicibacterium holsaticum TaxID=152142 RepID=A0A1E3RZ31_9MYCO|nr:MCE family protein [Mycolicibacterium holsaticum]ODQ95108.1 mammalian cell entry protein [Mycolicibacterium holsaticum]
MKSNLRSAVWRLSIFTAVCIVGLSGLLVVFAELRFGDESSYRAEFTNVSGLERGDFVRVAGVEVGKVDDIAIMPNAVLDVSFTVIQSMELTRNTRAAIRYDNVLGDRYLALEQGTGHAPRLEPGQVIAVDHTRPALDLDALIGGFRPLFRALDPEQVNALAGQMIRAFQGEGATVGSLLAQTSALSHTLADRDELIGDFIDNLNTVMGTVSAESGQLGTAIDSVAQVVETLAGQKAGITNAVAHTNDAAATVADLLARARASVASTVRQADRTAGIVMADHEYLDNLLNTLPDAYQALARQGIYGDFFSFYLCDAVLKMNGKGGQPVYIKLAGQSTGRCAAK